MIGKATRHHWFKFSSALDTDATAERTPNPPVESDPGDVVHQDETWSREKLPEQLQVDALILESVELDARLGEELDGGQWMTFRRQVPSEVELPGGDRLGSVAVDVGKGEAELDDGEYVDIALDELVVVQEALLLALVLGNADDTRELCVLHIVYYI